MPNGMPKTISGTWYTGNSILVYMVLRRVRTILIQHSCRCSYPFPVFFCLRYFELIIFVSWAICHSERFLEFCLFFVWILFFFGLFFSAVYLAVGTQQ